ncbi:DUF6386 family protein [Paenibacillus dauci]|uniref:DUF6386 family protein n=1 Tax=Paenibacillus dauci TaxID=1567106 RepID=UPI000619F9D6|nr:DUF6386 family protein [Paenibacillus dauci]
MNTFERPDTNTSFSFSTDTAALAIFDMQAIHHRITDTPDWWTIPEDELAELNQGNIVVCHLPVDGTYDVQLVQQLTDTQVRCHLHVPSGQIFIGAGEDITGGDLQPDDPTVVSGQIITLPPGNYELSVHLNDHKIQISFIPAREHHNSQIDSIRLG